MARLALPDQCGMLASYCRENLAGGESTSKENVRSENRFRAGPYSVAQHSLSNLVIIMGLIAY